MTGMIEQQLVRVAGRAGWKLCWRSAPSPIHPAFTHTELDIFEGSRLVTATGPLTVMHAERDAADNGTAKARESIAKQVIDQLPRRGAGGR